MGPLSLAVSLLIAFIQMIVMLVYMMHIRRNNALTRFTAAVGFIWLLIMFDLTLGDYFTRSGLPSTLRESWKHGEWPSPTNNSPALLDRPHEPN